MPLKKTNKNVTEQLASNSVLMQSFLLDFKPWWRELVQRRLNNLHAIRACIRGLLPESIQTSSVY